MVDVAFDERFYLPWKFWAILEGDNEGISGAYKGYRCNQQATKFVFRDRGNGTATEDEFWTKCYPSVRVT